MSAATNGSTSASYIYDAFGKLIEKNVAGYETVLMYDESGHLLGEYTSYAVLVEETIWMGDIPVATLRRNGTSACTTSTVCVFYVHTDQLNAPRKISQPSSNTLAWRWDTDPFGTVAPTQNPGGLGTFPYNLRFPGQYYQGETGLNYNYFRDYDPQTGRYLESDPIGLNGGINPYAYADGNPISNSDPTGEQIAIEGPVVVGGLVIAGCYITGTCQQLSDALSNIMSARSRGKSDPVSGLTPVNPGKDCNGNCKPCPPNQTWQAPGNEHGSTTGTHWHGIFWNQDKSTCMCYPTRVSGKDQQDLH
jgi:RHS repeat-associated protein